MPATGDHSASSITQIGNRPEYLADMIHFELGEERQEAEQFMRIGNACKRLNAYLR